MNGVKTWCTFAARADVLMLLARTDPDRSQGPPGHLDVRGGETPRRRRGLRPQARADGRRPAGSRAGPSTPSATGACTPTSSPSRTGSCPRPTWSAGADGLGRGFYLQMQGFENGRLQTAARAVGRDAGRLRGRRDYAANRRVFGAPIVDYQLTRAKLGSHGGAHPGGPPVLLPGGPADGQGRGALEASMVKAYVCRAAEWVTREAMQIHGGMGYAEEFPVSRYFVDARVLSIFEGADETLALKVIARRLLGAGGLTVPLGRRAASARPARRG